MPRAYVLAIVTIAAAITAAPAQAATLTVTTTADETTAGDHACSLREAVAAVNSPGSASGDCAAAAFGPNTIVLGPQTYSLGIGSPALPDLSIASNVTLTINGAGESRTTIDARPLFNRVFEIAAGARVTISDLTITGGHAPDGSPGGNGPSGVGGAGSAGGNGGAILNQGALTIADAAVTNSRAGDGGAGASPPASDVTGLPGHDGGAGGAGGGIFNAGSLTLTGATIAGNHAGAGGAGGSGGAGNTSGANHGGNGAAGGSGGGVANAGGTLTISGTTLRANIAGDGGAGGAGGTSTADVGGEGGNAGAGGSGGGIWSTGGSLSVTNSTLASDSSGSGVAGGNGGQGGPTGGAGGNGADNGSGGGVAGDNARLLNLTIVGNGVGQAGSAGTGGSGTTAGASGKAGSAGGVGGVTGAALTLQNSLLALNASGNCGGSVSDGGHNLSFGGTGCPGTFITGDPVLGPLQDNGGPSPTVSLGQGSAAIDKIPATGAGCPPTDQRGVRRPAGSECDIGAYEFAPPKIGTVSVTNVGRTNGTVNALVTPNAGSATVEVDYGRTKAYGSKSVKTVGGVTESPVAATLSHLRAKTTYHFRIVVTAPDGTATSADRTFATSPAPVLSKLKIKPSAFRAGGRGATIAYTDSLAASVTFTVLRRAPGSRRFVRVGSFTHKDKTGPNSVRFNGRLRSGKLGRGSYRLELTGRANGRSSKTIATTFRITG